MSDERTFDFWYAVNNTEVVLLPTKHLETFGTTMLNYYLVTELMDSVDQIRVREGRMKALRPQIITPEAYSETLLEGFGEEAHKYVDWLKDHERDMRILQYGYTLKNESFSEHVVTDNVKTVVERVKEEVSGKNDPFNAIAIGVDDPWDVCLVKMFWEVISKSAKANVTEMERRNLFEMQGSLPRGIREEIEKAFLAASKDSSLINRLGQLLQHHRVFEEYQDRFFSLVKASKR
jgi:hypothetical protein